MQAHHITLPIYNLGCGSASRMVEQILAHIPGVSHVYVNASTEMAYVEYDGTLVNSAQLFAALEREGFGEPARRPSGPVPTQAPHTHTLDARRMALAGGIVLAAIYTLCVLADYLFPNVLQMYRVWELALIGVSWADPRTLPLGVAEMFLYGAGSAWAVAALYNALPSRAVEAPITTDCATQPVVGKHGSVHL